MAFFTSSTVAVSTVFPARSTVMGHFLAKEGGFPAVEIFSFTMMDDL